MERTLTEEATATEGGAVGDATRVGAGWYPAEKASPAAPPPAGVPGAVDLGGLASRAFVTGPAKIASMIDAKGAAQQPAIDATRSALATPPPSDAGVVAAERRIHDVSAQQPSKGLRAFLAPVDGEDPLASINKLVQAVGLFAGGLGIRGSAHGAAKGSVAALTGAIAGWNAGDKERADRDFKDWKAKSDEALKGWEVESAAYQRALTTRGLTLQERMDMIRLAAMEHDNPIAAEQVRAQGVMGFVDYLTKREDIAAKMTQAHNQFLLSYEQGNARIEETKRHNEQIEALRREQREQKTAADKEKRAELDALWSGPTLRNAAIEYATSGKLPAGLNRSGSGAFIIPKLIEDSIAWAHEQGIDPNTFPSLRADIKSAGDALKKLRGANVIQEASIKRLDGHLDKLIELSAKVPRTQRPIANEYILKGRKDWAGDVDTANYILQGLEVGQELAKAFVGTAQGDAATREEGRKVFAAGLTHEQVLGAVTTLRDNIHRNLEINKESETAAKGVMDTAMKGGKKNTGTEVLRRADPRYKKLRDRGMSDEQIAKTYSVVLAD